MEIERLDGITEDKFTVKDLGTRRTIGEPDSEPYLSEGFVEQKMLTRARQAFIFKKYSEM